MNGNGRWSKHGLWVIVLRVNPKRRTKGSRGAYVTCWVNFRLYEGALLLAKHYVTEEGWRVRSIFSRNWINKSSDVPKGSRQYFLEAQAEGASLVFHKYGEPSA